MSLDKITDGLKEPIELKEIPMDREAIGEYLIKMNSYQATCPPYSRTRFNVGKDEANTNNDTNPAEK